MKYIKLETLNSIAVIKISNPKQLNALNRNVLNELKDILSKYENSKKIRSLILTGMGEKSFIAGADIKELSLINSEEAYEFSKLGNDITLMMDNYPKPIIGAINGFALGGGCEIILHSNFVQAHIESYIGLTEAALGILPAWGGCKEILGNFTSNNNIPKGPMPAILKAFELIGTAKVSTSAHEAKQFGYLSEIDGITMNRNRLLFDAKIKALELISDYRPPENIFTDYQGKQLLLL